MLRRTVLRDRRIVLGAVPGTVDDGVEFGAQGIGQGGEIGEVIGVSDRGATSHGSTGQERPSGTPSPVQPSARPAKGTRISGLWVAVALFAVALVLLLVFILENSQRVEIGYFGVHGHMPLGIALLLAAVLGVVLAVIAWFGRGVQVRAAARRNRKN
jgi:uncharacterized integral membrane protein